MFLIVSHFLPFSHAAREAEKQKKAEKKAALEAAKANGTASGGPSSSGGQGNLPTYNQFTVGINLLDRDERSVNEHVNVRLFKQTDFIDDF